MIYVQCVPKNFLKVTDNTFYFPKELEDGIEVNKIPNGKLDAVEMLYTN